MTCRIIASLDEVAADYDAVLCDLWGCYHNGIDYYPAAVAACRRHAQRAEDTDALTQAGRAEQLLFDAMRSHSLLNATRRALADMRVELAEVSRLIEFYSKKPRWWTGRGPR